MTRTDQDDGLNTQTGKLGENLRPVLTADRQLKGPILSNNVPLKIKWQRSTGGKKS
jgi:hypothetical protein